MRLWKICCPGCKAKQGFLSPIRIVYSQAYEVDIGVHVFPTVKFRLIRERLVREKAVPKQNFIKAAEASEQDLLLVHTRSYLDKLARGTLSTQEILTLELPYSPELVRSSRICVGGTILTAQFALEDKVGLHLGGGFHHAFADHGEGFCVLNDVACAAKFAQLAKGIKKVMIVDCDLHQGNGNADIFKDDPKVFTFSIHQQNNYPAFKPASDLDIGLPDGTADQKYLQILKENLSRILADFRPQLILYIAGADPYSQDQLGGLNLTLEGLAERDSLVFGLAQQFQAAIAVVFGGGYAQDIQDTVSIHYNTVRAALQMYN